MPLFNVTCALLSNHAMLATPKKPFDSAMSGLGLFRYADSWHTAPHGENQYAPLSLQDDETCVYMGSPSVLQEEEALMQQRKERISKALKVCQQNA